MSHPCCILQCVYYFVNKMIYNIPTNHNYKKNNKLSDSKSRSFLHLGSVRPSVRPGIIISYKQSFSTIKTSNYKISNWNLAKFYVIDEGLLYRILNRHTNHSYLIIEVVFLIVHNYRNHYLKKTWYFMSLKINKNKCTYGFLDRRYWFGTLSDIFMPICIWWGDSKLSEITIRAIRHGQTVPKPRFWQCVKWHMTK